jgi:hypothetical protein
LIDWFPDKKGLASGLVIAGFGSGALFFTPMMNMLTNKFSTLPTYLGSRSSIVSVSELLWLARILNTISKSEIEFALFDILCTSTYLFCTV